MTMQEQRPQPNLTTNFMAAASTREVQMPGMQKRHVVQAIPNVQNMPTEIMKPKLIVARMVSVAKRGTMVSTAAKSQIKHF